MRRKVHREFAAITRPLGVHDLDAAVGNAAERAALTGEALGAEHPGQVLADRGLEAWRSGAHGSRGGGKRVGRNTAMCYSYRERIYIVYI